MYDPETCSLDLHAYSDTGVYKREQERVFATCWLLVGHQSLVEAPGAFFSGRMGELPVLVWRRSLEAPPGVFVNACPISGRLLTRAEEGVAETLTCRCHGLRFGPDGYTLDGSEHVHQVRCESYAGLLFATLDASAPPLEEYLGDFRHYLDLLSSPTMKISAPIKSVIDANWKAPMDAFLGGLYQECLAPGRPEPPASGLQVSAGPGALLAAGQDAGMSGGWVPACGGLFPNVALSWATGGIIIFQPRGPNRSEAWSFLLTDPAGSDEQRRSKRLAWQHEFAATSALFQDLAVMWAEITRRSAVHAARRLTVQFDARGQERYHEDLPGLVDEPWSEMAQRSFYERWRGLIAGASEVGDAV